MNHSKKMLKASASGIVIKSEPELIIEDDHCGQHYDFHLSDPFQPDIAPHPYICDICDRQFVHKHNLARHMQSHTYSKSLQCEICHQTFSSAFAKSRHMITHSSVREHSCQFCEKTFRRLSDMRKHRITHDANRERKFECDQCGSMFFEASVLKVHMKKHSDERPHICEYCQKAFKTRNKLKLHKNQHIVDDTTEHRCDQCNKSFKRRDLLKRHMYDAHFCKENRTCEFCGKTYSRVDRLKSHLRLHTNGKVAKLSVTNGPRFHCDICGRSYAKKFHLAAHMRKAHEKSRTNQNELQKIRVNDVQNSPIIVLRQIDCPQRRPNQQRSRLPWVPYAGFKNQCERCGARFKSKAKFEKHVTSKTCQKNEESPFSCTVCPKRSATTRLLYAHMALHYSDHDKFLAAFREAKELSLQRPSELAPPTNESPSRSTHTDSGALAAKESVEESSVSIKERRPKLNRNLKK